MRSPKTQKYCPADAAPHTHQHPFLVESFRDYLLDFSAWGSSQHGAVRHSAVDTAACAKLPDSEGTPLAPYNVAHGDHTQHVHCARPHTMTSLPAHPGPAETPSSTLLTANRQNVPCFSATLNVTRPETLCFVSVSPLTRLKAFYLFCESNCRCKTDARFSVALYVALTLHYVALKRPVSSAQMSNSEPCRHTVARATLSNVRHPAGTQTWGKGLYAAPFLGMETRHGFLSQTPQRP